MLMVLRVVVGGALLTKDFWREMKIFEKDSRSLSQFSAIVAISSTWEII